MAHVFNRQVFERLPEEKQSKVEIIYHIASMLDSYKQPQLTADEFDILYDKSVNDLEIMSGYIRSQCHAAVYPEIEGE